MRKLVIAIVLLPMFVGPAWAQSAPPGTFPTVAATPLAQSEEPPLADPATPDPGEPAPPGGLQPVQAVQPPGSPLASAPPLSIPGGRLQDPPTPVIALRLRTVAAASVGQDIEYLIHVENRSKADAHAVELRVPLPVQTDFVRAEPVIEPSKGFLVWAMKTLPANSTRDVKLVLRPKAGPNQDIKLTAYIAFQHGQQVLTRLTKSTLQVRQTAPSGAVIGETVAVRIDVTNTGRVDATDVVVTETLPEGYSHDAPANADNPAGKKVWNVGTLRPNQTHSIDYRVRLGKPGDLKTEVVVTAAGGVQQSATTTVRVAEPRLELALTGPASTYGNQAAQYEAIVKNSGSAVLHNVVVTMALPPQSELRSVTRGGQPLDGAVQWVITKLDPNTTQPLRVQVLSKAKGRQTVRVTAAADRAPSETQEVVTDFLQAVGLDLTVRGKRGPAVGETFDYTIAVTNRGTVPATKVEVVATLPAQLQFVPAAGAKSDGPVVRFDPIPSLPENQTLTVTLKVRAIGAGDARLKLELRAAELPGGPIRQEESTFVVNDSEVSPPEGGALGGVVPAEFQEPAPE